MENFLKSQTYLVLEWWYWRLSLEKRIPLMNCNVRIASWVMWVLYSVNLFPLVYNAHNLQFIDKEENGKIMRWSTFWIYSLSWQIASWVGKPLQVWRQWSGQTPLQILDSYIKDSYCEEEVAKCIQIGLLCVQEDSNARPSMSTVVSYTAVFQSNCHHLKNQHFSFIEQSSQQWLLRNRNRGFKLLWTIIRHAPLTIWLWAVYSLDNAQVKGKLNTLVFTLLCDPCIAGYVSLCFLFYFH